MTVAAGVVGRGTPDKPVQGMHAAGVAVFAHQCLAHGADRDALLVPGQNFFAVRFHRREILGGLDRASGILLVRRLPMRGDQAVIR
jgi:hypothetical protein